MVGSVPQPAQRDEPVARRARAAATPSATPAFLDAAAPLLKALAQAVRGDGVRRRRGVRRRDRATRRWRWSATTRLALHVEIDVAAETRAPRPRRSTRLEGEIAQGRTPSSATRASSRARRPRWSIRRSSASPTSRRRCAGFEIKRARLAIVGLNSRARRRRAVEQLVDAAAPPPRRCAWRDSRVVLATRGVTCSVSMPCSGRPGSSAPGSRLSSQAAADAAARQRRRPAPSRRTGPNARCSPAPGSACSDGRKRSPSRPW